MRIGGMPLERPDPAQEVCEIAVCKRQHDPSKKTRCDDLQKVPLSSGGPNDCIKVPEKKGCRHDGYATGSQCNSDLSPARNSLHRLSLVSSVLFFLESKRPFASRPVNQI